MASIMTRLLAYTILSGLIQISSFAITIYYTTHSSDLFDKGCLAATILPVIAFLTDVSAEQAYKNCPQLPTLAGLRNLGFFAVSVLKLAHFFGIHTLSYQTLLAADDVFGLYCVILSYSVEHIVYCLRSGNYLSIFDGFATNLPNVLPKFPRNIGMIVITWFVGIMFLNLWCKDFYEYNPGTINPIDGTPAGYVVFAAMTAAGAATFNGIVAQQESQWIILAIFTIMVGCHIASAAAFYLTITWLIAHAKHE